MRRRARVAAQLFAGRQHASVSCMRILTACGIAVVIAQLPLLSQQPAPGDPPPITVLTGCLRSSGAATEIAGPDGRLYTLEVTETPPTPAATTTTASTPAVASKTTYSLSAPASIALDKHVDHQVELTGRLQAPSPSATSRPGTPPAQQPKPGGAHRTFEVKALKMVATTCK
jgi:hypothetical protein